MSLRVAVRREDKSAWERRVAIVPEHARQLQEQYGIEVWVQPSPTRIFRDEEFIRAGVRLTEDISPCPVVFGIKEIAPEFFQPNRVYVFFAHVTKGQLYNMPMLRRILELRCGLIDYEKITDDQGRRLVFFGRHAGLAGMLDSLWALGRRLDWEGIPNPFSDLRRAYQYEDLAQAKATVAAVGARIAAEGLPAPLTPFIFGFAGYGNVFRGANEIVELLPLHEIEPAEVAAVAQSSHPDRNRVYKVVFKEEHTVAPVVPGMLFDLQDYYAHPEKYRSMFSTYLPHLTMLVNCIYWEAKYPRLVTKEDLRRLYGAPPQLPRLRVIGDISCDIEGAIEATLKTTMPDQPVFVYDPLADRAIDGVAGRGPVILAVDILPSELPRDAAEHFSAVLMPYIPAIARADYSAPFEELALPAEIKRAVIVHRGELTPNYRYLADYVGEGVRGRE